jgi:hypothetical protein
MLDVRGTTVTTPAWRIAAALAPLLLTMTTGRTLFASLPTAGSRSAQYTSPRSNVDPTTHSTGRRTTASRSSSPSPTTDSHARCSPLSRHSMKASEYASSNSSSRSARIAAATAAEREPLSCLAAYESKKATSSESKLTLIFTLRSYSGRKTFLPLNLLLRMPLSICTGQPQTFTCEYRERCLWKALA